VDTGRAQFLTRPVVLWLPLPGDAAKIRCRIRSTSDSTRRHSTASQSSRSSEGPFTAP
jgi:hypothetical protein